MKIKSGKDGSQLLTEMKNKLQKVHTLVQAGHSDHARVELEEILAAGEQVTAEPGELLICCDSMEQFLYCSALFMKGTLAPPLGTRTIHWHPVPLATAHVRLGSMDIDDGRDEDARSHFLAALGHCPVHFAALHEMCYLLQWRTNDPAGALRYARIAYGHALQAKERSLALRDAGAACIDLGVDDLARCFYLEAEELDPGLHLTNKQLRYIRGSSITGLEIPVPEKHSRKKVIALLGFVAPDMPKEMQ